MLPCVALFMFMLNKFDAWNLAMPASLTASRVSFILFLRLGTSLLLLHLPGIFIYC